MKRIVAIGLALLVFAAMVLSAVSARAESYVDEAAGGLKSSHLYISPSVKLTDQEKANLTHALQDGDNVFIAVMPSSAGSSPADVQGFANDLEQKLPQPAIVGVAVGKVMKASSSHGLPGGIAEQRAEAASSIATTPYEALGIFVRDVHRYQVEHPAPKPPDPNAGPTIEPGGVVLIVFGCIIVAIGLSVGFLSILKKNSAQAPLRVVPKSLRPALTEIDQNSQLIAHRQIGLALESIYSNTLRLFEAINANEEAGIEKIQAEHLLKQIAKASAQYLVVERKNRSIGFDISATTSKVLRSLQHQNDEIIGAIRKANRGEIIRLEVAADMLDSTGL